MVQDFGTTTRVGPGGMVVVRGPDPYTVADDRPRRHSRCPCFDPRVAWRVSC